MASRFNTIPERDDMMEKYMRLSRQSDRLRQRLFLSVPTSTALSPTADYDSMSASITRKSSESSIQYSVIPASAWPAPSQPVSSIPDHHTAMAEEATLHDINQQIKATLTELLNCDSVKHDKPFRTWVQARLMDAEMELKRYRRRRSSTDKKTLEAFKYHTSHPSGFGYHATF